MVHALYESPAEKVFLFRLSSPQLPQSVLNSLSCLSGYQCEWRISSVKSLENASTITISSAMQSKDIRQFQLITLRYRLYLLQKS
jgi:hypothetical protein